MQISRHIAIKQYRYLAFGVAVTLCVIAIAAVLLHQQAAVLHVEDEIIQRMPFAVPGLPTCPGCNVILVSLDTLRADELPCYGYARNTAPNLCAFAGQNIQFNRLYSESSNTLDGHMSIFTGLYPSTHHVINELTDALNPNIKTLTETLAGHGYKTIYAGTTGDPNLPIKLGLGRGFTEIHPMQSLQPGWKEDYMRLLPELTGTKPAFIFLHTYAVHDPYVAGHGPRLYVPGSIQGLPMTLDEFSPTSIEFYQFVLSDYRIRLAASDTSDSVARSQAIVSGLQDAIATGNIKSGKAIFDSFPSYEQYKYHDGWYWHLIDKHNPGDVAYIRGLYDERLHSLDANLKPLLEFVSRPEIKRKTIIIFVADHGEEFMEHRHMLHTNNIYNTVTHVPFIMAAPRIPSGQINALVQNIDLYPTILALTGIQSPGAVEGNSILPILLGDRSQKGDPYVISEHRNDFVRSIQDGSWKLYVNKLENGTITHELYNLVVDPAEQHNVLTMHPDIQSRLTKALKTILSRSPVYKPINNEFPDWIDQKTRDELSTEGYF